jgi:hypothetical protein
VTNSSSFPPAVVDLLTAHGGSVCWSRKAPSPHWFNVRVEVTSDARGARCVTRRRTLRQTNRLQSGGARLLGPSPFTDQFGAPWCPRPDHDNGSRLRALLDSGVRWWKSVGGCGVVSSAPKAIAPLDRQSFGLLDHGEDRSVVTSTEAAIRI